MHCSSPRTIWLQIEASVLIWRGLRLESWNQPPCSRCSQPTHRTHVTAQVFAASLLQQLTPQKTTQQVANGADVVFADTVGILVYYIRSMLPIPPNRQLHALLQKAKYIYPCYYAHCTNRQWRPLPSKYKHDVGIHTYVYVRCRVVRNMNTLWKLLVWVVSWLLYCKCLMTRPSSNTSFCIRLHHSFDSTQTVAESAMFTCLSQLYSKVQHSRRNPISPQREQRQRRINWRIQSGNVSICRYIYPPDNTSLVHTS